MIMEQFSSFVNKTTDEMLGVKGLEQENLKDMFHSYSPRQPITPQFNAGEIVYEYGESYPNDTVGKALNDFYGELNNKVSDVKINGVSIVSDGVANIPTIPTWELINDYTPTENINTINIITDSRNESFRLKKALILCQYQATDTTTNNNEVVVDMRGGSAQFSSITNCNSANTNGDCVIEVDCSSGMQLCKISYSTTPIITATDIGSAIFTHKELVNPSVNEMTSFKIRLGNSAYKFNAETTRIRLYGVRA